MFVGRLAKEPSIVNFADGKKVVNTTNYANIFATVVFPVPGLPINTI